MLTAKCPHRCPPFIRTSTQPLTGLAGLPQNDEFVLALIAEAAPHARAMAGRLDRDYAFSDEI